VTTTGIATCPEHGDYECKLIRFAGMELRSTLCPICEKEKPEHRRPLSEDDKERTKQRDIQLYQNKMEGMGIHRRFYDASFESFDTEIRTNIYKDSPSHVLESCIAYARDYRSNLDTGKNLFLIGGPGTGKNHLAASILKAVGSGRIAKVSEIIRNIRSTYRTGASEQEAINSWASIPLLAINEIGIQYGTEAEKNLIFEVLDMRYENVLPTIMISNLTISDMKEFVGGRVIDRMLENAQVLTLTWRSYRDGKVSK